MNEILVDPAYTPSGWGIKQIADVLYAVRSCCFDPFEYTTGWMGECPCGNEQPVVRIDGTCKRVDPDGPLMLTFKYPLKDVNSERLSSWCSLWTGLTLKVDVSL